MAENQPPSPDIKCLGSPKLTETGTEVLGYHIERYLTPWLEENTGLSHLLLTLGFENTNAESCTFFVSTRRCEQQECDWTFHDLCRTVRDGQRYLNLNPIMPSGDHTEYELLPITTRVLKRDDQNYILGTILLPRPVLINAEAKSALRDLCHEAIQAARRNTVRLFFDENRTKNVKQLLYSLMDRLPEWTGCDHSAAFYMTKNLQTMMLDNWEQAQFEIIAERLFTPERLELPQLNTRTPPERLVGMTLDIDDQTSNILSYAVEEQQRTPSRPFQLFVRNDDDTWDLPRGRNSSGLQPIHYLDDRDPESTYVLIPLVSKEADGIVLLGFLSLAYRQRTPLPKDLEETFSVLGDKLASFLHGSPLYSIGARKLWIIQQVQQMSEKAIKTPDRSIETLESTIGDITELIAAHTEVPSFAIGYLRNDDETNRRYLRYVHPYGWTHFDQLSLPVDISPTEKADSSVSSLAVRLNKTLVLAGGHGKGESQSFKNYLWVNEETNTLIDSRREPSMNLADDEDWTPLKEYYKPARASAYATVAYPVSVGDKQYGVLTVEVERPTAWSWWTGFGGQLFWSMLADSMALTFRTMLSDK